MTLDSEGRVKKTLASIQRSFDVVNEKLLQALTRLDDATTRILALGEIHSKLAKTIMDVLGIPEQLDSALISLPDQIGAISSVERTEIMANGLLRPIVRVLSRPCGEIAEAIISSKDEILKLFGDFDSTEMEVLAREFSKDPARILSPEEQETFRNTIREWTLRLKDAFSGS
jgi:hypothetical protein